MFSPHLLPREWAGGRRCASVSSSWPTTSGRTARRTRPLRRPHRHPKTFESEWRKEKWNLERDLPLLADDEVDRRYDLRVCRDSKLIDTWDRLLTAVAERLDPGERLPGFPIWADEFRPLTRRRTSSRPRPAR